LQLSALVALGAWIAAAATTVTQKMNADDQIRKSFDVSAVQIQQLNGSVTSHALMWLLIACTATIPLLIVGVSALMRMAETPEEIAARPVIDAPAGTL
jgi:hypothetical protein